MSLKKFVPLQPYNALNVFPSTQCPFNPVLGGGGGGEGDAPGMPDMPEMFDEPTLNTLLNQ